MDIRKLTDELSVSPQLTPADIDWLKAEGFAAIVCNRPDGEAPDQPDFSALASAAQAAGLKAVHIPVSAPPMPSEAKAAFAEAMSTLPGPVLAYCRTGTRSAMLWALSQTGKRPAEEILSMAKDAGYDLSPLASALSVTA